MSGEEPGAAAASPGTGPVLFAYDGSGLAALAIKEAGRQLAPGRDALVLCVWQPGDVGFVVPEERHLHAAEAQEVKKAAEETAAHGASLAEQAGFRAQSATVESAPTWKGIVEAANEHDASLIVLGSHTRSGLVGHLLGSVTAAVMKHCTFAVLVVRGRS